MTRVPTVWLATLLKWGNVTMGPTRVDKDVGRAPLADGEILGMMFFNIWVVLQSIVGWQRME